MGVFEKHFDMAEAEIVMLRNPATLLFTPKSAAKGERRVMSVENVKSVLLRCENAFTKASWTRRSRRIRFGKRR
jgi:hypothetical protein